MKKALRIISTSLACLLIGSLINFGALAATIIDPTMKRDIDLIKKSSDFVLSTANRLEKYGNIDSESWEYPGVVQIAPAAKPILEAAGMDFDDYIWLAYGDKAGTVIETYMSYKVDKSELKLGEVISCIKFDVATGKYIQGTIKVSVKDLNGVSYKVILRETFKPIHELEIPSDTDTSKSDIKISIPKKMSIRFEDGTIISNTAAASGATIKMVKGQTIRFQMCSNNWDSDVYTDEGQGVAGTKVYSFTYTGKNNALRTDTNTYFMAVRFHFIKNGRSVDYNKQTGISQIVDTPLESLSVNLPIGSTIVSDAYHEYMRKDMANVFVETAQDKTICFTEYNWMCK